MMGRPDGAWCGIVQEWNARVQLTTWKPTPKGAKEVVSEADGHMLRNKEEDGEVDCELKKDCSPKGTIVDAFVPVQTQGSTGVGSFAIITRCVRASSWSRRSSSAFAAYSISTASSAAATALASFAFCARAAFFF